MIKNQILEQRHWSFRTLANLSCEATRFRRQEKWEKHEQKVKEIDDYLHASNLTGLAPYHGLCLKWCDAPGFRCYVFMWD